MKQYNYYYLSLLTFQQEMALTFANRKVTFTDFKKFHIDGYSEYDTATELELRHTSAGISFIKLVYVDANNVTQTINTNIMSFRSDYIPNNPNGYIDIVSASVEYEELDVSKYKFIMRNPINLYVLHSERNELNKSITSVGLVNGTFKNAVLVKNPSIDIEGFNLVGTFNYVFIRSLNRYYYVQSVTMLTNSLARIDLLEDVLMSWKNLIYEQEAYVTRSERVYSDFLVDDRYPLKNVKTIEYATPTNVQVDSKVNVYFDTDDLDPDVEHNILVTLIDPLGGNREVIAPDANLPNLQYVKPSCVNQYLLSFNDYSKFVSAIQKRSELNSFVVSALYLPFNPAIPFDINTFNDDFSIGYSPSYYLGADGTFYESHTSPMPALVEVGHPYLSAMPYFVIADIQFPQLTKWYDFEPYKIYEINIPFVGWVKIDSAQANNKRLLIYYVVDYNTGNATAYIYNKTDGKIMYSAGCQLGIKLPYLTTNNADMVREREAMQLNTLIGLLASAVSVGAGVAHENPVAIAGGVISAGKTIASAVNTNRMLYERGQVTYGSGDAGLHSNLQIMYRITYYEKLLSSMDELRYKHIHGYPSNTYTLLSSINGGYVEVGEIHFNPLSNDIYNDEINEIVTLLQSGVIL